MHVLLHIRGNAERKPGGDFNLLKAFAGLLRQRGHQATITLDCAASLAGCDAVLTINLDSPFEPALMLDRARRHGVPLCLYSLHHPMPAFATYLRHGSTGARRVAAALSGCDPQRYLGLLAGRARAARRPAALALRPARSPPAALQEGLLTGAAAVLVSSRLEREQIVADLPGCAGRARFAVVPHVFESSPAGQQAKDRSLIVCPGRIESRKNQLAILAIVERFPRHRFVFVGGLNPAERGYCRRFQELIARSANASHVGGMDPRASAPSSGARLRWSRRAGSRSFRCRSSTPSPRAAGWWREAIRTCANSPPAGSSSSTRPPGNRWPIHFRAPSPTLRMETRRREAAPPGSRTWHRPMSDGAWKKLCRATSREGTHEGAGHRRLRLHRLARGR